MGFHARLEEGKPNRSWIAQVMQTTLSSGPQPIGRRWGDLELRRGSPNNARPFVSSPYDEAYRMLRSTCGPPFDDFQGSSG